jgi:hypothetical protein
MNAATDTLKKVKTLLGIEVSLEQMKLENGTVLEAEKFEAGEAIFIVTEDEKVALPIGEYELENGSKLVVEEDGIIASVGTVDEEEVEEDVAEEEVEAEEKETEMEYVSKREFTEALTEIVNMIEELKNGDVEASEETSGSLKSRTVKEEFTENEEKSELETQLSEAAVKPLKHAPKEESTYKAKFNFNQNKKQTAYDRIVAKISNIKH